MDSQIHVGTERVRKGRTLYENESRGTEATGVKNFDRDYDVRYMKLDTTTYNGKTYRRKFVSRGSNCKRR